MELTQEEFIQVTDYMKKNYGINLENKKSLIEGRLTNHLARKGFSTFGQYFAYIRSGGNEAEAANLVNLLTTNHTFFYREPVHFEFLKDRVIPYLKVQEKNARDIRIWSAAASSGEEAYTIAMLLQDSFLFEKEKWDLKVLATDISTKMLAAAVNGSYTTKQLETLPKQWIKRYFKKLNEDTYQVSPELKKEVIFRQFNLMNPFPFKKKFHVIFLRNVMIYFDEAVKRILLQKVYEALEKGGYLFIGVTEHLEFEEDRLECMKPSVYRKIN